MINPDKIHAMMDEELATELSWRMICQRCPVPYFNYPKSEKQMTNADKIRAMTDEELAHFLRDDETFRHAFFPQYCIVLKSGENPGFCDDDCKECLLDWLKQEACDD